MNVLLTISASILVNATYARLYFSNYDGCISLFLNVSFLVQIAYEYSLNCIECILSFLKLLIISMFPPNFVSLEALNIDMEGPSKSLDKKEKTSW